jgi:hypothetical protein
MGTYRFTITEHDPKKPWLVVGSVERRTIDLPDELNFYEWAGKRWPRQRFTVQLDPQLEPWRHTDLRWRGD